MLKLPPNGVTELPGEFSDAVDREARKLQFTDELFRDREEVQGFTIDSVDSPDLDDAVWLKKLPNGGGYLVEVSISDVDSLVRPGSYCDIEALSRVISHYFPVKQVDGKFLPKKVIPMLPKVLSEKKLSLREEALRPTMTVSILLNEHLDVRDIKIKKTYLKSAKRMGLQEYKDEKIIGDPGLPLFDYYFLAKLLNQKRWSERSIGLQELAAGISTDEDGMVRQGSVSAANLIVQEFMLLANAAVAEYAVKECVPLVFRNHISARENPPTKEQIRAEIERTSDYLVLVDNLRATFQKFLGFAIYEADSKGHTGLGIPHYTHFTSPIRRFADLAVHRSLKAHVDQVEPPYTGDELNELCGFLNKRIRRLTTIRSIGEGINSLHNYRAHRHLLHSEQLSDSDYVENLMAYLKKYRIGNPVFEFTLRQDINVELACHASVRFHGIRYVESASGYFDKTTVKQMAAARLLGTMEKLVESNSEALEKDKSSIAKNRKLKLRIPIHETVSAKNSNAEEKREDPDKLLYRYCEQHNHPIPTYHYEHWSGDAGNIVCICSITELLTISGVGSNRLQAKRSAADKMIKHLQSNQPISRRSWLPKAV